MNNYQNLRKNRSSHLLSIFLVILILLELCSLAVLFSRLSIWVDKEHENIFPLTESTQMTSVKVGKRGSDGSLQFFGQANAKSNTGSLTHLAAKSDLSYGIVNLDNTSTPGLQVMDKDKIWSANTDVEIFKFTYENGENKVTVAGSNSDKLIAPGTDNKYSFTVKNTGDVSLDYKLEMEAYVEGTELRLPVVARVYDHDGSFLLGSDEEWADVLGIDELEKKGTLAADRYANYTIEWMWPFEGDDVYDTMLGNLATEGDLTLTIVIKTLAEHSDDPDDPGDNPPPQTGDDTFIYIALVAIAITVAGAVVVYGRKRATREDIYE